MRRYHINPRTGVPSICRAESGKCPYGGDTGDKNHYNTYSEAQKKSQEYFEKMYNLLPASFTVDSEKLMEEIEENKKIKSDMLSTIPSGSDYEITKGIMNGNEDLVMAVVEGEVYRNSGWTYTSVALQSPSISKKFLEDAMFLYPGEVDEKTRRWLILNKSLSHDNLQFVIEDENEDMWVRSLAFRNPNINSEYVQDIIENKPELLNKLPYSMILYSHNSNDKTEQIKDEAMFFGKGDSADISTAQTMAIKFAPWERIYRTDIAKENN